MYRLMQPEDKPASAGFMAEPSAMNQKKFAKKAIEQFAGEQNVYVAEENG